MWSPDMEAPRSGMTLLWWLRQITGRSSFSSDISILRRNLRWKTIVSLSRKVQRQQAETEDEEDE
uniref:Uncharacterized protein n=1 Tax=Rhizophora mucronata TaxID=61149 RepID=A0A2P2P145_RHIMU